MVELNYLLKKLKHLFVFVAAWRDKLEAIQITTGIPADKNNSTVEGQLNQDECVRAVDVKDPPPLRPRCGG